MYPQKTYNYEVDQELGGREFSLSACPGVRNRPPGKKKLQIPGGMPEGHGYKSNWTVWTSVNRIKAWLHDQGWLGLPTWLALPRRFLSPYYMNGASPEPLFLYTGSQARNGTAGNTHCSCSLKEIYPASVITCTTHTSLIYSSYISNGKKLSLWRAMGTRSLGMESDGN